MTGKAYQKCINPDCGAEFECRAVTDGFKCPNCGDLLDVRYNWDRIGVPDKLSDFSRRWASRDNPLDFSGVWRFRELLNFCDDKYKVTIGEGQTILQQNDAVAKYVDMQPGRLFLQYEGLNPSGSFKDNGMAAALAPPGLLRGPSDRGPRGAVVWCPDGGSQCVLLWHLPPGSNPDACRNFPHDAEELPVSQAMLLPFGTEFVNTNSKSYSKEDIAIRSSYSYSKEGERPFHS
jgi:predicted RNA-binding Zn-ribbon protein involved in translation (DUF1610 family)